MWLRGGNSLTGFLSADEINNSNRVGKKKKKNPKDLQNKSKNKNNKCFSWVKKAPQILEDKATEDFDNNVR